MVVMRRRQDTNAWENDPPAWRRRITTKAIFSMGIAPKASLFFRGAPGVRQSPENSKYMFLGPALLPRISTTPLFNTLRRNMKKHWIRNPRLTLGSELIGFVATITLTVIATKKAVKADIEESTSDLSALDKIRFFGPMYAPAAITAVGTIILMVQKHRVSEGRLAAGVLAYSSLDAMFDEYKSAVKGEVGEKVERRLQETAIAAGIPKRTSPVEIISGDTLCLDKHTGRFFSSSIEKIRRAENDINHMINHDLYVVLNEFYRLVGLPPVDAGDKMGWDSDRLMSIDFTSALQEDKPCIVYTFNYLKGL